VVLWVGIDEVGYGPKLGPLVVAAVCARRPLRTDLRIADSKKVFSQARGVGTLEPAVLGFVPAATFRELLERLGTPLPESPWYRPTLPLPAVPAQEGLEGAFARLVEPAEFNAATRERNKSDFLFEVAAGLIRRVRAAHAGPVRFLVGKQGGRRFYRRGIQEQISPAVTVVEEAPGRSAYRIPGATIEFLEGAEDRHELVALASMVGKYVRECAMRLFNDYWARERSGLRRTAGYGTDASRFYREIEPEIRRLRMAPEAVLRLR
jgi:ribonuclease HII